MNEQIRQKILALLGEHRIMTIATLRPDGWPQATTVGYANDGLSMAAHAQAVVDPAEREKAFRRVMAKYPEQAGLPLPMPTSADVRIFRVTPMVGV